MGKGSTFSVYGVKLHLHCATNRVPISYEFTPANMAEVSVSEEPLAEANLGEYFTGLVTKITAYTYAVHINRMLGRSQGRTKQYGPEPNNTHLQWFAVWLIHAA